MCGLLGCDGAFVRESGEDVEACQGQLGRQGLDGGCEMQDVQCSEWR